MTDERVGDALWTALRRLPPGSGVVVRHHRTPACQRRLLIRQIRRIAVARRLVMVVAGGAVGAGTHGVGGGVGQLRTWAAHDRRQAIAGIRVGAKILFVSPLFPTRSHPGAPALGPAKAARITAGLPVAAIALGGMTARRFIRARHWGFSGWAAIDALSR
ncbi:thiamine phosphate synthase [Sphingomonas aerophila]|nr:thiamine phosphate synthase [Sphingomonas aerophila]